MGICYNSGITFNIFSSYHMFWVLMNIASLRQFSEVPTKYDFNETLQNLPFNCYQISILTDLLKKRMVGLDKIIIYYLLSKVSQTAVKFQDDKPRLKLLI